MLFFLTACEQVYFYTSEANTRIHFYQHEEDFVALGQALDAHPDVLGATNCLTDNCWRIGRNFYIGDEIDPAINDIFVPYLNGIGIYGYVFFERYKNGSAKLPDYSGGKTGDFSLSISYAYWPNPDETFSDCKTYTPSNEDYYVCHIPLKHGWMIERFGTNRGKISWCTKTIYDCRDHGGTDCVPERCEIYQYD